ncbi:alpha/beta-hydrolase [Aaosphaeria arxii CBS 175.79]|uniref:Alpha/beta-hydrolase n=1 Tax=Aaosphaeria arxii CBS 175.79 TaxID=1450172 RepID=A0A6A5X9B1_9PLEO|nr:alpha/beta-hydrolase [Aaosphaeria arxii CBS 175.79]KAF2009558.1 alpha/beta-hydrolase [Aaosphaeria arxii CBS 175.79]
MGLLTYQPFKGVYLIGAIGFELARLPIWLIKYLTKYGRQHPEWTFRNALVARIAFSALYHLSMVQMGTPLPLTAGKEKERFVVIKPFSSDNYTGPFAPTADVKPVEIGASWYPAPLTPASDTSKVTVVLHFHGGAYVVGDGRTDSMGYSAHQLLKHGGATHVLASQYRLSSLPASATSNPFPAAVQDALTSYLYLVRTLGIPPSNIIVAGDSAGGNAAIALLRYISSHGADIPDPIPAPAAAFLWSPWISPSETLKGDFTRTNVNYGTDYLSRPFTDWGAAAYAGKGGKEVLESPYVSFKRQPFKTETKIWTHTGGAEVLFFDDKQWVLEMKAVGNEVVLDVDEKVPHDLFLMGKPLGLEKELAAAIKRAGEWFREVRK